MSNHSSAPIQQVARGCSNCGGACAEAACRICNGTSLCGLCDGSVPALCLVCGRCLRDGERWGDGLTNLCPQCHGSDPSPKFQHHIQLTKWCAGRTHGPAGGGPTL